MSLSAPFIRRPVATTLLAVALFLAGGAAFFQLPVAPLPKVEFPTISVQASLPGASPETMASAVATPLERRFGRIAGITEITSNSGAGQTSVTMQFELDRDVESAARDVQAAINAAIPELPANMPARPRWRKANPADAPILILSLTSDTEPLDKIFDLANTVLAQKIAQVSGVGQVFVGGGQQPAVRVRIDPDVLAGAGFTLEDVRAVLGTSTANQPKGLLTGPEQAMTIAASDQLFGAERWKSVVIGTSPDDGAVVRLSDVADVFDDVENQRAAAWANGQRAVLLIIRRQPGANILDTIERIKAMIPALSDAVPPGVKLQVAIDRAQGIRASVAEVERSLVFSVLLVIGVVFVFLRSGRATLIPTVAVPLSLVGTFGAMWLLDYSIDILSLMALTIATGFVVDDAIVVTENVARRLDDGDPPLEAALKGAKQIGFTIVSITVSLLTVFIPLFLMTGMVGRLLREFVVVLGVAISLSAVVSLTLTPMMCAQLLRKEHAPTGRFSAWFEAAFGRLVDGYERALRVALGRRKLMLALTFALVGLTVILFVTMPKGLFPQQDNGMLVGSTQGPQDVAFTDMQRRQEAVNEVVRRDPDVKSTVAFIGSGPGGVSPNAGSVFVELKPKPERKATADEVIARLRPKLSTQPGTSLFLQAAQDIRIGGRPTSAQYQYTMQGADLDELRTWAPKLHERLRKLPQLKDVNSDQQSAGLELGLKIDRETAARLGITPAMIDDTLYDAFGQRQVATSFTQLNQYRVVMEVKPDLQKDVSGLAHLYLRSAAGGLVPLNQVVSPSVGSLPLSVNHQGQFASVTTSFNLAPGVSLGEATKAIEAAKAELQLPSGVKAGFSGTAAAYGDSQSSQTLLIFFALLVVYVVLGMLYESYVHPLTILSTLPSAGVGALLALLIFKIELSVVALVAIILLIGIVKKNAIMIVDFALEAERVRGLTPFEAMVQACRTRFRPILMTTLAALLGGLPLALGSGIGSELRKPLGIAIVGGLLVSQLVTMFTTPVVYLALDRFSRHRKPHAAEERETASAA